VVGKAGQVFYPTIHLTDIHFETQGKLSILLAYAGLRLLVDPAPSWRTRGLDITSSDSILWGLREFGSVGGQTRLDKCKAWAKAFYEEQ
jgi:hypothetical protein